MCGPKARTNFQYSPNEPQSSSSKLLSATLTAKLHKCHMASLSLQMAKQKPPPQKEEVLQEAQKPNHPFGCPSNPDIAGTSSEAGFRWPETRHGEWLEGNWVGEKSHAQPVLDDDHIEQMIQELLHCGSIELCSLGSS